jgi:hypothetical protein
MMSEPRTDPIAEALEVPQFAKSAPGALNWRCFPVILAHPFLTQINARKSY